MTTYTATFTVQAEQWDGEHADAVLAMLRGEAGPTEADAIAVSMAQQDRRLRVEYRTGILAAQPGDWFVLRPDTGHAFTLPDDVFTGAYQAGPGAADAAWTPPAGDPRVITR